MQEFLDRRRPGQSVINTPRVEEDKLEVEAGTIRRKVEKGGDVEHVTLGTPISVRVANNNIRVEDYTDFL